MAIELQDLLDVLTEAVIQGQKDPDELLRQYNVPFERVDSLLDLIYRLQTTLVERSPSTKFMKQLKQEMTGRNRRLSLPLPERPGRTQLVAGMAAFACAGVMGVALLWRRHFVEHASDRSEVPISSQ